MAKDVSELNPLEQALGLAEAAMAHSYAVSECFREFVLSVKHPQGLPLEEWREKMQSLDDEIQAKQKEFVRIVASALSGSPEQDGQVHSAPPESAEGGGTEEKD